MKPFRIIPVLLIRNRELVKTYQFRRPRYLGDPINATRIFNDKEVDELTLLDIEVGLRGRPIDFEHVRQIVSNAFMPIAYGGGIRSLDDMARLFQLGVEKVVLGTAAAQNRNLIEAAAKRFGSQSIVVSVDIRRRAHGVYQVYYSHGRKFLQLDATQYARQLENAGAGELLLNDIDRESTMTGYDLDLILRVTQAVTVPVIANGGAGSVQDLVRACAVGGAAAAAAGSMFVYVGTLRGILITYPTEQDILQALDGLVEDEKQHD